MHCVQSSAAIMAGALLLSPLEDLDLTNSNASVAEMGRLIGREGMMPITPGATVAIVVRVLDAKTAYGGIRVLVSPLCGFGETWIELRRLTLTSAAPEPVEVG